MIKINRQYITKVLSIGVMLMGIVNITATFTPLIADNLKLLPYGAQAAFTYFSLMCGTLLILGGFITYSLSGKIAEHSFVRNAYILALAILNIAGILAVCYMRHNPFAWVIFILTIGLMAANVARVHSRNL